MLLLARKIGEEILIDKGQISIKFITMRGNSVVLGIQASRKIDVDRKEVYLNKLLNPQGDKPATLQENSL